MDKDFCVFLGAIEQILLILFEEKEGLFVLVLLQLHNVMIFYTKK